jgi:hypothetical protein
MAKVYRAITDRPWARHSNTIHEERLTKGGVKGLIVAVFIKSL